MKNSFFNFKIILIVTSVILTLALLFFSSEPSYEEKEVTKTVNLQQK